MQKPVCRSQDLLPSSCVPVRTQRGAFTLVELLAVIGIIVIMFGLAVPAINGMKNAGDVNKSVYDIAGILDQARAYAMGNSTYVYVGFQEVDASVSESKVPQVAATATKGGRVAVGVFASKDGTGPTTAGGLPTMANLTPLQKVKHFENLHIADFFGIKANSGPMKARDGMLTDKKFSLGAKAYNAPVFNWPLTGTPQYTFSQVIQISPQGVASMVGEASIPPYMEIGLQQTKGNILPDAPSDLSTTNLAAIQIDGIIGSNRIFRP